MLKLQKSFVKFGMLNIWMGLPSIARLSMV